MDRTLGRAHGERHVVVDPVADIVQPCFCQQAGRGHRFGFRGRQPAAYGLAAGLSQDGERVGDQRLFLVDRQAGVVQVVHVQAVGNDLPAALCAFPDERRVADGHCCIDRDRCADLVPFQGLHDAEDADAVAVVAQAVVAQVRVGGLHRAGWLERQAFHVQREPLQRRYHPQGDACTTGPGDRRTTRQDRPVVQVMVHAIVALAIFEVFAADGHGASPTGCAAAAKAS